MTAGPADPGRTEQDRADVRDLLEKGLLDLPLPGRGRTSERLSRLAALGESDLVTARLAEAHTDAVAILADLDASAGTGGGRAQLWGVWAAAPPQSPLRGERVAGTAGGAPLEQSWTLTGPKPWCSGATVVDRALLTAETDDGYRLFAVDPRHPGVTVRASRWAGTGMKGSDTCDLDLVGVPARAVGGPDAYLHRPGFWWGAAGVGAVWLGGARRVSRTLEHAAARHGGELVLASLGRVDAAQHAAWCALVETARLADSAAQVASARLAAARARAAVETAVEVTLLETARATGPGPLATDADHARHVADLQVYVRQSHGDRDLAVLGGLVVAWRAAPVLPEDGP